MAFVALIMFSPAMAQDDESNPLGANESKTMILVGPVGGLSLSNHTGGFRTLNDVRCPVFSSGTGWGFLAGISVEVQPAKSWSIIPRLLYESRPGHFTQRLDDAKIIVDSVTIAPEVVSTTSDITYQFLSFELMYSQHLASLGKSFRLNLNIGPTVGYVFKGKVTQVQDLELPLNAQFTNPDGADVISENNGRRLVFARDRDIDGLNKVRFSLKGGLVGEVGLFNNEWIMYPGIFYDFGLSHVTKTENWNLNSFIFQVDFRHAF